MAHSPTSPADTPIPGRPVRIALVGAGNRGLTYADWIHAHPEQARLTVVADPRPEARRSRAPRPSTPTGANCSRRPWRAANRWPTG